MTQAGEQNRIKKKYKTYKPLNKKIEIMVKDTQRFFPTKRPKGRGRR